MKRGGLFLALVFVGVGALALLGSANTASALTVSPPTAEYDVTPGQPYQSVIKLINETNRDIALYTEVANFSAEGEDGVPAFDFNEEKIDLSSWVTIDPGPFALAAGQTIQVPVTITPPTEASPGGHYAGIFFSENPPATTGGGQVAIGAKIGTLYLVRVAGEIDEAGSISSFKADQKNYSRLPVEFTLKYHNAGNIHLRPSGDVTIKNMFGKETGVLEVNAKRTAVLPDQTRKYSAVWERAVTDNTTGNAWSDFWTEYGNERKNLAFGRYTASVLLVAGSGNAIQSKAQTTVWVFPWHVIIVYGIIILAALFAIICFLRWYNHWIIHRATQHFERRKKRK